MCWCDEYELTINRADELMLHKLDENIWFVLDPETIRNMITFISGNHPKMTLKKTTNQYEGSKKSFITIEMRIAE